MATIAKEKAIAAAVSSILSTTNDTKPAYEFSFTPFLRANGLAALASNVPVCETYASTGHCPLGRRCPNRHPTPNQQPQHHFGRQNDNYVCKHWLKGLCKKGDACDYLHEYNLRKMSECQFFNQNGYCQNGDECLYVHVKEDSKLPLCEDYNKGFCEKGPRCGKRHVRRKICEFYMAGFCPDGPECKNGVHLKSGAKAGDSEVEKRGKDRVAELEKREEDQRKEFGNWRDKRAGEAREEEDGGTSGDETNDVTIRIATMMIFTTRAGITRLRTQSPSLADLLELFDECKLRPFAGIHTV